MILRLLICIILATAIRVLYTEHTHDQGFCASPSHKVDDGDTCDDSGSFDNSDICDNSDSCDDGDSCDGDYSEAQEFRHSVLDAESKKTSEKSLESYSSGLVEKQELFFLPTNNLPVCPANLRWDNWCFDFQQGVEDRKRTYKKEGHKRSHKCVGPRIIN